MIPYPQVELHAVYGNERRLVGVSNNALVIEAVAANIGYDAVRTVQDFDGIDDELVAQARAEARRLLRLLGELAPDAGCLAALEALDGA